MLLKEKGYDEFLAEKIRRGLDDVANGRVVSLAEAQKEWEEAIRQAGKRVAELEQLQTEVAYG